MSINKNYTTYKVLKDFNCEKMHICRGCDKCPFSLDSRLCTIAQCFKDINFIEIVDDIINDLCDINEKLDSTMIYEKRKLLNVKELRSEYRINEYIKGNNNE